MILHARVRLQTVGILRKVFWALTVALFGTACIDGTPKISFDENVLSQLGFGGASVYSVNSTLKANFSTDNTGMAFFATRSFDVIASCDRGVDRVRPTVNGVDQTAVACNLGGQASFSFSVASDGLVTLVLTPISADGTVSSSSSSTQLIYAKTTAPPAPVVTGVSPSGSVSSPYTVNPGTVTVSGTMSTTLSDYISSVSEATLTTGTMTYDLVAGTWSYSLPITQGNSVNLAFRTHDRAGNVSSSTAIMLVTANALALYANPGAGVTSAKVSGLSSRYISVFSSAPLLQAAGGGAPTSGSGVKLYLGVPSQSVNGP